MAACAQLLAIVLVLLCATKTTAQSASQCTNHGDCGGTTFCSQDGECQVLSECHLPHDSIDGVCPKAGNRRVKQKRTAGDWMGLKKMNHFRGDGGHESLWGSVTQGTSYAKWSAEDAASLDVPRWHFDYYDRIDRDGFMTYREFIPFARERFLVFEMTKADLYDGPDPKGHNQQLGSHRPPSMFADVITDTMHPRDFWKNYVYGHKPVLFRGVDKDSIGFKKWDPDYLEKNFGFVDLKIEPKIEARGDSSVLDSLPKRLSIPEFMDRRVKDNIYAVSILPQAMAWEVNVPPAILCGARNSTVNKYTKKREPHGYPHPMNRPWLTHIYEANLWLADGRTRSQLHYDKESNMNCLYRGEKQWIFIDTRKHFEDVLWARAGRYRSDDDLQNAGTDWVPIDPDKVDLRVHKDFSKVEYYSVTQKAGDCLFLPHSMLHWVNKTSPGFQVATSYMWLPTEQYDEKICEDAPLHKPLPMATFDILWYFSGKGIIPQGYPDPDWEMLREMMRTMQETGKEYFTFDTLKMWLSNGQSELNNDEARVIEFHKRLSSFGKNPEKGLHMSEMRWPTVPLDEWLKLAAEGDPEGGLPCDQGQTYNPRPADEWKRMDAALQKLVDEYKAVKAKAGKRKSEL